NLIPDNIIAATFSTHYTALVPIDSHNLTLGYKKLAERAFKPNIIFSLIMSMAFPGAPSGGSSIVNFIAFCSVIGIDNPLDILAYTMTMDWLMVRTMGNV
ncbi:unnamed protein product, partial [Oppiella nova]